MHNILHESRLFVCSFVIIISLPAELRIRNLIFSGKLCICQDTLKFKGVYGCFTLAPPLGISGGITFVNGGVEGCGHLGRGGGEVSSPLNFASGTWKHPPSARLCTSVRVKCLLLRCLWEFLILVDIKPNLPVIFYLSKISQLYSVEKETIIDSKFQFQE